jgi:DNA-directed RNA polymerase subunit M/transcription elongation factor TFIIS
MQVPGKIIARCPQCSSGMHIQLDSEHRKWLVCWQCGAQIPIDYGMHIHTDKPNLAKQNSENVHT